MILADCSRGTLAWGTKLPVQWQVAEITHLSSSMFSASSSSSRSRSRSLPKSESRGAMETLTYRRRGSVNDQQTSCLCISWWLWACTATNKVHSQTETGHLYPVGSNRDGSYFSGSRVVSVLICLLIWAWDSPDRSTGEEHDPFQPLIVEKVVEGPKVPLLSVRIWIQIWIIAAGRQRPVTPPYPLISPSSYTSVSSHQPIQLYLRILSSAHPVTPPYPLISPSGYTSVSSHQPIQLHLPILSSAHPG